MVVTVETFLDDSCVTTCDIIPGYSDWVRSDRYSGQRGGIAMCHRDGLQINTLQINVSEIIEILFFCIFLRDRSALLLCATYQPQWQANAP